MEDLWWWVNASAWVALGSFVARWAAASALARWARVGARLRERAIPWLDDRRSRWWAHALRARLHRPEPGSWWTDGADRALVIDAGGGRATVTDDSGIPRTVVEWSRWLRHYRPMTAPEIAYACDTLRSVAEIRGSGETAPATLAAEALDVAWSWRGPWLQMGSGRRWYPLAPFPSEVCLLDLSGTVIRWSGACGDYTTHEHQIRVALLLGRWNVPAIVQLEGLVHDAHETYPPYDVPSPVKVRSAYGREALAIESLAESAMRRRYHLPAEVTSEVRLADAILRATEARDLLPGGPLPGFVLAAKPLDCRISLAPSEPWRLRWIQLVGALAHRCASEERARLAEDRVTVLDAWERIRAFTALAAEARQLARKIGGPVDQDAPTEVIEPGMIAVWDRSRPDKPETAWWGHVGCVVDPVEGGSFTTIDLARPRR